MDRPPPRYRQTSLNNTKEKLPNRRSSQNFSQPKLNKLILSGAPPLPPSVPPTVGITVPSRGTSQSPIRRPESRALPRALRKAPSRTFVPSGILTDILDFPTLRHPRILLHIHLSSSLFVGGATVEGKVGIVVDGAKPGAGGKARQPISIDRITVTVIGVERSNGRQWIFRSLATELIDEAHPPPPTMTDAGKAKTETLWEFIPSQSTLPFRLDLPVIVGPPPHDTKKIGIYYLLSVTIGANIASKRILVRKSRKISVLTVHDRTNTFFSTLKIPLTCTQPRKPSSTSPTRSSPPTTSNSLAAAKSN